VDVPDEEGLDVPTGDQDMGAPIGCPHDVMAVGAYDPA
jgi:hypothetical protein